MPTCVFISAPHRDTVDAVTVDFVALKPVISSSSPSFRGLLLSLCSGFFEEPFEPLILLSVRYEPGVALEALSVDLWWMDEATVL